MTGMTSTLTPSRALVEVAVFCHGGSTSEEGRAMATKGHFTLSEDEGIADVLPSPPGRGAFLVASMKSH